MATLTERSVRLTGADGGPLRGDVRTAEARRPAARERVAAASVAWLGRHLA